jgi:hypothetical protein
LTDPDHLKSAAEYLLQVARSSEGRRYRKQGFAKSVPPAVLRINPFEPLSIYEVVFNQSTLSNRRKLNGTRITWSLPASAEETTGFIDKLYIGVNFCLAPQGSWTIVFRREFGFCAVPGEGSNGRSD